MYGGEPIAAPASVNAGSSRGGPGTSIVAARARRCVGGCTRLLSGASAPPGRPTNGTVWSDRGGSGVAATANGVRSPTGCDATETDGTDGDDSIASASAIAS